MPEFKTGMLGKLLENLAAVEGPGVKTWVANLEKNFPSWLLNGVTEESTQCLVDMLASSPMGAPERAKLLSEILREAKACNVDTTKVSVRAVAAA